MKFPVILHFPKLTLLFLSIFCIRWAGYGTARDDCGAGTRPLFFFTDSKGNGNVAPGLKGTLFRNLKKPLEEIGYCLTRFDTTILADSSVQEELVMVLSMDFSVARRSGENGTAPADSPVALYDTSALLIVSLVRVDSWSPRQRNRALETPLLTLSYSNEDLPTFVAVLVRKIIENLRMQYICHLRIESIPGGVTIRSNTGLEGTTPLEWITPVGKLPVIGELEGYEPIRRKIDLNSPGMHTYVLEMRKRRFSTSRFFVPTLVLGSSSAVTFLLDRYFYNKYSELGKADRTDRPGEFSRNYTLAKSFERIAVGTLALSGVSLALCFVF